MISSVLFTNGTFLFGLIPLLGMLLLFFLLYQQIRNTIKLKELNQKLAHKNEIINQFTHITSHDLREMVRNISTFNGLLQQGIHNDAPLPKEIQTEYHQFIEDGAKTLNNLIESLKVFTESTSGKIQLHIFELDTVFKNVSYNLESIINEKNASLKFEKDSSLHKVYFSQPMLEIILQELIKNGLLYNDSSCAKVKVNAFPDKNMIKFIVEDNGHGIPPEMQEYIFKPFKSLNNKTITHSSGLGLSICQNILNNFGGEIGIISSSDHGSKFYFKI